MEERHLSVWILVWGSTSASLSTADMSLPELVRLLPSRLRAWIIHLSNHLSRCYHSSDLKAMVMRRGHIRNEAGGSSQK